MPSGWVKQGLPFKIRFNPNLHNMRPNSSVLPAGTPAAAEWAPCGRRPVLLRESRAGCSSSGRYAAAAGSSSAKACAGAAALGPAPPSPAPPDPPPGSGRWRCPRAAAGGRGCIRSSSAAPPRLAPASDTADAAASLRPARIPWTASAAPWWGSSDRSWTSAARRACPRSARADRLRRDLELSNKHSSNLK